MPYVTQQQIETAIPAPHLIDALDDDGDQVADPGVLATLIAQASTSVDSYLASIYATPFADPAPATVRQAAFVFAAELIYARRERPDATNPWSKQAAQWRETLQKIGHRELPLDANIKPVATQGAVISCPVSVDGSTR